MAILPVGAGRDARTVTLARAIRAFVDGVAFVVIPAHLVDLGFSGAMVGATVSVALAGSAVLTLATGWATGRAASRTLLLVSACLMAVSGPAFALAASYAAVLVVAALTTMNPAAGDVSPFLPLEQSMLSASVPDSGRTTAFAGYNLVGSLVGSAGALCAAVPLFVADRVGASERAAHQSVFLLYGAAGVVLFVLYRNLVDAAPGHRSDADTPARPRRGAPLSPASRRHIGRLAALFSLDSFGGGFATQAIFSLWMFGRFGVSTSSLGAMFFVAGVVSAFSSVLSVRIANRIGLVRTMVWTHVPASVLLVLVALAPNLWIAVGMFLARALVSQMDVPARTSYVMAIVEPHERARAASITNVPRSLAAAVPPVVAGWMLDQSRFGWPLVVCAACKITYDLALLASFRHVRPPEESGAAAANP